jgi:TonB-dependent receptor
MVVTSSLRSSLQSAQSIKRNSRMVVDSIVAEDIGKLPGKSVADALQRITGVQVSQGFQGATTGVVVRGLPDVVTTLNGHEIFSSNGRGVAFQNIPATAVKAIKVYKTSDASLLDGGIAGLVDTELYKPLDFKGSKVAGTLTETYSKNAKRYNPDGSLLLSNRWNTGIGEVGALVNFGFRHQYYNYDAVWGDTPILVNDASGSPVRTSSGNLVAAPQMMGADYNVGDRHREETNYALQWQPNQNTQFYLEGIYDWDSDHYSQPFFFAGAANSGITPSNLKVTNNCYPNQLTGGAYEAETICDAASGTWTGNLYAASSTQAHTQWGHDMQNTLGMKWHSGNWQVSSNISRTTSSFHVNTFIIDTFLKGPLSLQWNGTSGGHQNWSLAGAPATDPGNFYLNGLFQDWTNARGKQWAWRGDATYDIDGNFFQYLQFGTRYSDHKATARGAQDISTPPPGGPGTGNITANPTPGNNVVSRFGPQYFCAMPSTSALPTHWLTGCYDYLVGHADALRAYYGLPAGQAPENPGRFFDITEKKIDAYAQFGYDSELFGMPVNGLFGLRAEQVRRNLDAFSYNAVTQVYSPISPSTKGTSYLPNFSFNLHITEDLKLRLDWAKTLTYPGFGSLNPSISLNPGTINRAGAAASGNANLSPIKSSNSDLSLEWYFSPVGYVSGGLFYRDISGYIQNYVTDVTINGEKYQLSSPQSAGSGYLDGAEFAYQQQFDFLPGAWNGLGVQLNYTYINGDTKSPEYIGGPTIVSPLQGVSKTNYNVVLFYEKYGFQARLAYDYRDRYIDGFNQPTVAGIYDEIKPANQVDFSISYALRKNLTLVFNASNLTGAKLHQYWGAGDTRPRDIRYQDRRYGLGLRFKL